MGIIDKAGNKAIWVNCFYNKSNLFGKDEWLHTIGTNKTVTTNAFKTISKNSQVNIILELLDNGEIIFAGKSVAHGNWVMTEQ